MLCMSAMLKKLLQNRCTATPETWYEGTMPYAHHSLPIIVCSKDDLDLFYSKVNLGKTMDVLETIAA